MSGQEIPISQQATGEERKKRKGKGEERGIGREREKNETAKQTEGRRGKKGRELGVAMI